MNSGDSRDSRDSMDCCDSSDRNDSSDFSNRSDRIKRILWCLQLKNLVVLILRKGVGGQLLFFFIDVPSSFISKYFFFFSSETSGYKSWGCAFFKNKLEWRKLMVLIRTIKHTYRGLERALHLMLDRKNGKKYVCSIKPAFLN